MSDDDLSYDDDDLMDAAEADALAAMTAQAKPVQAVQPGADPLLQAVQLISAHVKAQDEQQQQRHEALAKLNAEPNKPLLPDGIGMNLDDIRLMLAHVHDMRPPEKDDPLLMVVSILNAHLAELDKLHQRQSAAMTKLMAEQTANYVQGVQETADNLAKSLQSASLEGLQSLLQRVDRMKMALWWAAAIISLSALLNVAIFVLRGLK